jgi:hypothetical protein
MNHAFTVAVVWDGDEPGALIRRHDGQADEAREMKSVSSVREALAPSACTRATTTAMATTLLGRIASRSTSPTLRTATRRAMSTAPLLVSPKDLDDHPSASRVFLDASWHMPGSPRNARKEFEERRLPGARFLDLDEVASSHELGLKHMMPSGDIFARACGMGSLFPAAMFSLMFLCPERLGIEPSSHVVMFVNPTFCA